jgi:CheY-like chemotaxis protein
MRTLLWIDDHVAGVALRKPILESSGYSVLTATTARQGLELISACPVEAVIIDYPLPDMPTESLVRRLRTSHSALPIVVFSRLCSGIPETCAALANAIFTKAHDPFSALVAQLGELLSARNPLLDGKYRAG